MRKMLVRLFIAAAGVSLSTCLYAQEQPTYAEISLAGPGSGRKVIHKNEFIVVVVEGANLSFEGSPIPSSDVVTFINEQLKVKKVSYIGMYAREGSKFGDVIRAVDLLRGTNAKNIGISISELPVGREP